MRKLTLLIIYIFSVFQCSIQDYSYSQSGLTLGLTEFISNSSEYKIRSVQFNIEDDLILLNLSPLQRSVLSKNVVVWTVKTDKTKGNYTYKKLDKNQIFFSEYIYEDIEKKAVLHTTNEDEYTGVIGEGRKKKVIHFLPGKQLNSKVVKFTNVSETFKNDITSIDILTDTDDFVHFDVTGESLNVLYPKLLVIVDYNLFKMLGENILNTMKYVSTFWNAVNLKYKEITYPQVKITITGIVISKDETAPDFIFKSRNRLNPNIIDNLKLISLGNRYFKHKFKKEAHFNNFDSAALMTNISAGSVKGSTLRGQICNKNIIYITDDAQYAGVIKAAHELGHSLGLTDDNRRLAHPPHNSTVMTPFVTFPDKYYWSQYSLDQLSAFTITKQSKCLEHDF